MTVQSDLAINYLKENKKEFLKHFSSPQVYFPLFEPTGIFMAGSPGAGKTEFSKNLIKEISLKEPKRKIVRIDADEIRDWLPQYDKTNASEMSGAANLGVAKLIDSVFENDQDFLLDSTFSNEGKAYKNLTRCLQHKRKIVLIYLYQEPKLAWKFTLMRQKMEGRPIPKEFFVDTFLKSKELVNKYKKEFGDKIELTLYIRDFEKKLAKSHFNIDNVDNYLSISYTPDDLFSLLEQVKL